MKTARFTAFPLYYLCAAGVASLAALLFLPGLGGGFMLDDGFNILDNRLLYVDELTVEGLRNAALSFHDGNGGRPLPMLSFALDYWRAGAMNATTFKITNLVIHGVTTFFLVFLLRRLLLLAGCSYGKAAWGALALALAWAVHPLQVSSVLYIVQRMQTMATLFIVLALWAYVCMRQVQMDGTGRGRLQGIWALIFWALAFACKEDAPLFFAYVLILELTVLRFRAVQPEVSKGLKQTFGLLSLLAVSGYLFWVVPHYWSWDAYGGRDFSSLERLMTQARVLTMYLGQIVLPWPDSMIFIYDNFQISRSLWNPWTTLPSIILIVALIVWGWLWRRSRPLFSFGVLLFFSGHFITSNIIALELVFEHRNHLPLIGIVLAVGDLLVWGWNRLDLDLSRRIISVGLVLVILVCATLVRSYAWGDPVRHGEKQVELLPQSTRAWTQLGGAHFDLYHSTGQEVYLRRAIEANERGLSRVKSPPLASNLVIYKSLLGTVSEKDWQSYWEILREGPKSWQDKFTVWTMMNNVDRGFDLDAKNVVKAIQILAQKTHLSNKELLRMAVFSYKNGEHEQALPLFIHYAQNAPAGNANLDRIMGELSDAGHEKWVEKMRQTRKNQKVSPGE